jgi:hypothetical protein
MKKALAITFTSFLLAGNALAADCNDPVADWQPREVLQEKLQVQGWKVTRIKVDDGCYEVKGIDRIGNRFEAEFAPASLKILELTIKFDRGGDAPDYLDKETLRK